MNEDIRIIQQSLFNLGYDPKGIDGYFGKNTATALRALADNGLKPTPKPSITPVPGDKKIAIVIGHNPSAQGAVRVKDKESEYVWNSKLAAAIVKHGNGNVKVFRRQAGMEYYKEIDKVYDEVNAWGPDVALELHFNANENRTATGTETLSTGSTGSLALAKAVQANMVRVLGLRDRGVTTITSRERGGRGIFRAKAPAILLETYFGSNYNDCNIVDERLDVLAKAIYDGAAT